MNPIEDAMRPAGNCGCGSDAGISARSGCSFAIRRHDTAPRMEIEVKDANGQPLDLTDWTAEGTLTWRSLILRDITDDEDDENYEKVLLDSVASCAAGDIIRIEEMDGPRELLRVISVDRINYEATVERGYDSTTPANHSYGTPVIAVRSTSIPVEVVQINASAYVENDPSTGQFGDGVAQDLIASTKLVVKWRSSDTAISGNLLLEIKLTSPDDLTMTMPLEGGGYPVSIRSDADDSV